MQSQKAIKVIIDTNLWISFLIGKELQFLKDLIEEGELKIVMTAQLVDEISLVVNRPKLKRYFDQQKVNELITLLDIISIKFRLKKVETICRDPKDDFLLALAKVSKADFLVTGDKDLLSLYTYGKTKIITANELRKRSKN
ncbi:MAG: putative toxin-antitoxin system toxin component, PIN family [Cyclobacteriaceae bacterium]|jgi:hypothetical protein|nr:putative toxin-antitoxin system toxin component, PIN family [Cyclobacteriaceae bacterium]